MALDWSARMELALDRRYRSGLGVVSAVSWRNASIILLYFVFWHPLSHYREIPVGLLCLSSDTKN